MRTTKPVLLIDQDDVLAEYIKAVAEAFNQKYHTNFTTSDCDKWNLVEVFGTNVLEVMQEPELFRNLEPVQDALEVFERLYRSNLFEMYIVTAAQPTSVPAKALWLKEHLPFFPQERFIVCSVKYMVKGDYLLDDGMHNIRAFAKAGGTPIIFNRMHNNKEGREFERVYNWKEFEKFIINECYGKHKFYNDLNILEEEVV